MKKILIIEDSLTTAEFIADKIKKENYLVNISNTGDDALDKLSHENYHLVLLDLILPDYHGSEILKEIRKNNSPEELPVIIISAIQEETKIAQMLNLGANDFLTKPFSEMILQIKVKNFIQLQSKNLELKKTNDKYRAQSEELRQLLEVQNQTYNELAESEAKYRHLFQFMDEGIVRSDNLGYITLANNAMANLFNYNSSEEMIGKHITELYPAEARAQMVQELRKNGHLNNYEVYTKTKHGLDIWVLCNIREMQNENGDIIGREGIIRDVTQLKKAENKLKENELKLKELIATKDKFFSILAHDLKNPFGGILGFSDLLYNSANQFSREEIIQFTGYINQAAQSAYKLLENLLEWSRAQTGKIEFKPEFFYFNDLLREVISLIENFALTKNITINYNIENDYRIYADKNMINTVLRNLITNAVKFTHDKGTVKIDIVKNISDFEITVADTGIGMTSETTDKLFKISEKVSRLGTAGESGTGLGLILCKEFIEKHGGTIRVETTVGKGSRFCFTLPETT